MPKLIEEFAFQADLIKVDFGAGPFGHRVLFKGTGGGEVTGARLKGSMLPPGGDWLLMGGDGFGRLDVRANIETVDGAFIYLQYYGLLELTPTVLAVLGGDDSSAADDQQYFFTHPRLETGDERYSWVNKTMFLGEGRISVGPRVDYQVYRVIND